MVTVHGLCEFGAAMEGAGAFFGQRLLRMSIASSEE